MCMKKLFLISSNAGASESYFTKSEIEEVYREDIIRLYLEILV